MGMRLDAQANAAGARCIDNPSGSVRLRVMHTDEEGVIARYAAFAAGLAAPKP